VSSPFPPFDLFSIALELKSTNSTTTQMLQQKSAAMKTAHMVLRTAQLLDDYNMLGKDRRQHLEEEINDKCTNMQKQQLAHQQDYANIVRANQLTTARVQQSESQLIDMRSQIDTLHRARINQLSVLQNTS
jgi:hypothetical protein